MASTQLDLNTPAFRANAYDVYADLRSAGPISRVQMPDGQEVWLVTGYHEAAELMTDYKRFKTIPTVTPEGMAMPELPIPVMRLLGGSMGNMDPPDHTRLRRLVQSAFTPRYVELLRPRVQEITDQLLDKITSNGSRRIELVEDFAVPLPLTVISEMLGLPEKDRDRFRTWAELVISLDPTSAESGAGEMDPLQVMQEIEKFISYIEAMIEPKRAQPGNDLISGMVQAEDSGERMTDEEILKMVALLIVGGLSTTQHLIGNMMLALFKNPDQMELLKTAPSLAESAVEEMLRYHGPIEISFPRFAAEDVEIAGTLVRRGDMVIGLLAAASRDPERFENPHKLDLTRRHNRHLAFGKGAHMCLGAPLARVEGQVALTTLLRRLPAIAPAVPLQELTWRPGLTLRGLTALPVKF